MTTAPRTAIDPIIQFLLLISRFPESKRRGRETLTDGQIRKLVESLPAKVRESARAVLEIADAVPKTSKNSLAESIERARRDVLALMEETLEASMMDFNRARWDRALGNLERGMAVLELIPGQRSSVLRSVFAIVNEMVLGQQKHMEIGDAEALDQAVQHLNRANRLAEDLIETLPAEGPLEEFERMLASLQLQRHFMERGLASRRNDEREAQRLDAEFLMLIRDIQRRIGPEDEMVPWSVAVHALPEGLSYFQRSTSLMGVFDFEGAQQSAARAQAALRSFSSSVFRKSDDNVLLPPMTDFYTCMLEALDVHELTLRIVTLALQGKMAKPDVASLRDSGKRLQDAADRMTALKPRLPAAFVNHVESASALFGLLKNRLNNLAAVSSAADALPPRDLTGSFGHALTGYQFLEEPCRRFLKDHPDRARNVFIMTPYHKAVAKVIETLEGALRNAGLNPLRADGKNYLKDRNLWHNICVYMLCCETGVAVLENQARREFNPNVALEYGFMRALDKRVLLLTEKNFKAIRADIGGVVREPFDARRPQSVVTAIGRWLHDLEKPAPQQKGRSSSSLSARR
jgi:hypothetical protein